MSWNPILRKALTTSIAIAVCLCGSVMAQTTLYVDGSVAATGDGSMAAPFKTITEALRLAVADPTILVAGGTYTSETPYTSIRSGQTLIGGYDSTFTTSDPLQTPTVIDMGGRSQLDQRGTFYIGGVAGWTIQNLVIQNSTTGEYDDTENGGAVYVRSGSNGVFRGVTFSRCATKFEGGVETGPAREGGAVCIRDGSTVLFEDCVFDRCTAVGGGCAIRMRNAGSGNNVRFYRCLFTQCGARSNAATIDDGDGVSQLEIVNCIFANNGVDVDIPSGTAPSNYLIRIADRRALIYNCTFVGNNNPDGYMFSIADSSDAVAAKSFVNCIVANNTIAGGGAVSALFSYGAGYNDATTIENNLFFSNSDLDPLDPAGAKILGANGNLSGDPQFADAENGDYHLNAGSPAENAGKALASVVDDFASTARPVGPAYDIGALEGQASAEPSSFAVRGVVATASSSSSDESGPQKTADGSGLNALDEHDTALGNMWMSGAGQVPPVWIQYEFDTVYKLDEMWVWNSNNELEFLVGLGVKTATIEYSTDGVTWTALAGVPEFARAPGAAGYAHNTTVDFGGVAARFVRITCTSTWGGGGQYGLSEVRFYYVPVLARDPKPATGAKGVALDATLSWTAGREAASHEVHLGTDLQAVEDGTVPVATVSEALYAPVNLQLDTTYYWKVVEVNQAETPSAWEGKVWSFSTSAYQVVDDFESYTGASPNRIFQSWIDGAGFSADEFFPSGGSGNGTGSLVGNNDPPYAERAVVHGGWQSMPLTYDGLSETTRTFSVAQDWTQGGITTLILFFRGESGNGAGELYVKINGAKVSYSGSTADLAAAEWKQCSIALPAGANLGAVGTLTIGVSSGQGKLYIDDIRLVRTAPAVNP